jgi:hypothetical protein
VLALAAGLALRLWMLGQFFNLYGDPKIYGDLAKNLLLHGSYARTGSGGELIPSLMRLPGYPLFLALCFRLFGMENYVSAAWVQIGLEMAGCLLLADFARLIAPAALRTGVPSDGSLSLGWSTGVPSDGSLSLGWSTGVPSDGSLSLGWSTGAAHCTLWLAALCPFTAVYAAEPLTEGPTLFTIALALWSMARFRARPGWLAALGFTFAVTFAAMLRPEGALLAVVLTPALLMGLGRGEGDGAISTKKPAQMAVVCVLLALAPFAAWGWRNWQTFHIIQPLAPRRAIDPSEIPHPGWERWVKSWCLDFNSTIEVFWKIPGETLEINKLPARAFDSPAQYAETARLAADYNQDQELTPELDARFGKLAGERIAAHPLRYYLWLPLGRMADMWLRPRVENLPIDLDWWNYENHDDETCISWAYVGLNVLYLLLGVAGMGLRPRFWRPMLAYMLLRSALLTTITAPEARYTLECFPMLFALGGVALWRGFEKTGVLGKRIARWRFSS